MPRLRNKATGVVVNVDDAVAEGMRGAWAPVTAGASKKPGKADPKSDSHK